MKIKVDKGAVAPSRAHETDAGLDLYSTSSGYIRAHSKRVFGTGVHVQIPHGCCGLLVSKSGLNVNKSITTTGLIDEGYTGEIMVSMYNHGDVEHRVEVGDKISQLVIIPCRYEEIDIVDEIEGGERDNAGFGSTGR